MFDITASIDLSKLEPLNKEGKNSDVYSYHDDQLGKDFIVKQINKQKVYEQYGSDYLNNLFSESKILYSNKHPNIVEIQYASYDKDNVYISMPKYKNGSLNALISSKFLTVREILKISLEFLSGLHYVHTNNLIHFDIKPTNILIDDNGKAVLTDFGLAKYVNTYGIAIPDFMYSAHKPPEHFKNAELTNKSDIYQAGITLYRLCNGNNTFYNQLKESDDWVKGIIKGELPNRKFYLPHIPVKLQKIINKSINKDPDKRYDSILEMINQLSIINEYLDWRYVILNDNEFVWSKMNDNGTHLDCIKISKNDHNKYDVKKEKKNIEKNSTICSKLSNCKNLELSEAYKLVADTIKTC